MEMVLCYSVLKIGNALQTKTLYPQKAFTPAWRTVGLAGIKLPRSKLIVVKRIKR